MREEFIKDSKEINGVTVYDCGSEFVFTAKNYEGQDVEHHFAKKKKFPIAEHRTEDFDEVLEAATTFPNLPLEEAFDKYWEKKETA